MTLAEYESELMRRVWRRRVAACMRLARYAMAAAVAAASLWLIWWMAWQEGGAR